MSENNRGGPILVIGGAEDKAGDKTILKAVAAAAAGGKLVIATVASRQPEEYFEAYCKAFSDLGCADLVQLYVTDRSETHSPEKLRLLDGARGVFFTGGDQLRISSQIGDTPIEDRVREIWRSGGVLAGTSAGASVMSDTMLVRGPSAESHRIGDLQMAPGLGLIRDVIIDQHFAERGRIGRLLGAVAHSPRVLGIGVDEDTAMLVHGETFEVLGSGAVYVVDGEGVSHSNISEGEAQIPLSMYDVKLHVLAAGDVFHLADRQPRPKGKA